MRIYREFIVIKALGTCWFPAAQVTLAYLNPH